MEISSATSVRVDLPSDDKVAESCAAKVLPVSSSDSLQEAKDSGWSFSYAKVMVVAAVAIGIFTLAAFVAKYVFRQEDRAQSLEARVQYYKEQMRNPSPS